MRILSKVLCPAWMILLFIVGACHQSPSDDDDTNIVGDDDTTGTDDDTTPVSDDDSTPVLDLSQEP